ncbi:unnamed protein product [Coregonus sp. 'balchen']|nr:unnamed protein product [Coregonus sp. 'balchen']
MYLNERPLCGDYPYPLNSQPKNYGYCPPDWKDAVRRGSYWDAGGKIGGETKLSTLQVRVSLQGRELWEQFGDIGTEMLITKTGRRMFPNCKVTVTGLNSLAKYMLIMDMVLSNENKYKGSLGGITEPHLPNCFFIHPNSASLGERWMQCPVSFHKLKLKLTNTLNSKGLSPDPHNPLSGDYLCFTFPEATFIAVTAYQNSEITKLKIGNNPFAKGFRDSGLNRKRFREKEGQSSDKLNERQRQMESKPSNDRYRTDDITSLSAAPNPIISAFMNWGAAIALPSLGSIRRPGILVYQTLPLLSSSHTFHWARLTTQGLLASGGPRHRAADQWGLTHLTTEDLAVQHLTSPTADHHQAHQK